MTPRYAAYGLCALIAVLALAWGLGEWQQGRGHAGEIQSAIHQGEAQAHATQAGQTNPEVADLKAKLADSKADLGRLHAERDALLRKLASKPKPGADSVGDNLSPTEPVGDDGAEVELLRATVAKDAEVIEALVAEGRTKDALIGTLTIQSDHWRLAYEAERKATAAQEAATRAWKQALTTGKWRGRIEGFAAGAALGYVGGRR